MGRIPGRCTARLASQTPKGGAGLRFLTGATTSPTLADQFHTVLQKFPAASKWHRYEPKWGAPRLACGCAAGFWRASPHVLSDRQCRGHPVARCRFLVFGIRQCPLRRGISHRGSGDFNGDQTSMNRLYVVESNAGPNRHKAKADPSASHARCGISKRSPAAGAATGVGARGMDTSAGKQVSNGPHTEWIAALVKDLQQHTAGAERRDPRRPPIAC